MSFEAYLGISDSTATLHLAGDLLGPDVNRLRDLVEQAARTPVRRLVIHLDELRSISGAGIRCLALAQQQVRPGTQVIVDGADETVRAALRDSGLDRSVTVVAT
ncbi:STAS domain-containing protein [Micromonospora sp. WMMD714]|uniref:STAS domain-containing protein n=1 Tax=Micromonospora sp. WMMD714 TaxID=3016097 RepID=UPI00249AD231|nr:STAS domain-containing protein [Micromonospora sp. WMMD714]WFE62836.1 STAS domain-containing protein [Micromonospora sp. WMMD714]